MGDSILPFFAGDTTKSLSQEVTLEHGRQENPSKRQVSQMTLFAIVQSHLQTFGDLMIEDRSDRLE